jgi:hypothetical protein
MKFAARWGMVFGLSVASCGDSGAPAPAPDASPVDAQVVVDAPVVTDTARPDTAVDVPADTGPRPIFSPCTSRAQCGTGRLCSTITEGYPGGSCTRACTMDAECGDEGLCWPVGSGRRCIPRCQTSEDCREGYACLGISGREDSACFPHCTADAQCAPMACNQWSRECGRPVDTTRAENGAPCNTALECRSERCTREVNSEGNPTGSLGGICYSLCTVLENSEYVGANIPRANCPMGSVCPRDSSTMPGGVGLCRVECTTNDNCRPGFICVHPARSAGDPTPYVNGYCAAMNCRYMTQTCPAFATCTTTRTDDAGVATSGVCVRNDPDGGDGASDAAVDATSDRGADATDAPASDAAVAAPDAAG